ncbi:DNA-3-methyladenine glycosylase family protein [Garciella nitratireducens]|uniref:DNA-3-methyladenine glycosylase family protein n=1 Tax=Garciella nitratireducens TaxID=218205 RepID=UPI000DE82037|nr:DNA glycosylase [Garciella nitratireducens]RBP44110.1 N-glycosylase/DNA lyase [Garciella nitratireducens]
MKVEEFEQGVVVRNLENFYPVHTFECGQCFRWNRTSDNTYIGIAYNKVLEVELKNQNLYIYNINLEEFYQRWIDYFDLKRDYKCIQQQLQTEDAIMREAISEAKGIRILNQDPWEILISFIISANKNISHIKIIIERFCQNYGDALSYKGKIYYTFPTPYQLSQLTIEEILKTKCGYRAKFIYQAIQRIYEEEFDLYDLKNLPIDKARKELLTFYGVGPKIADCILLFSLGKSEAFPVDVWVKRVMEYFYFKEPTSIKEIQKYAKERWGHLAGFAQQYLFHYARNIKKLK